MKTQYVKQRPTITYAVSYWQVLKYRYTREANTGEDTYTDLFEQTVYIYVHSTLYSHIHQNVLPSIVELANDSPTCNEFTAYTIRARASTKRCRGFDFDV